MKGKHTLALILAILPALLFSPAAMCTEIMPPPDNPLLEAVKKGDVEEVNSILTTLEARKGGNGQGTDSAKPLAGYGSDEINERGNYGYTPLATAAKNGNLEIVRLLAEHGAAIDGVEGDNDRTPLMEAASYGHVEVVTYLISKGADVNVRRKGLTPLLVACDHFSVLSGMTGDKKQTVSLLLEKGADVNVQDESWLKSGMTPLMFAVAQGDAALVQAMIARGANLQTKNSTGDTALSLAKREGLEYISGLLETAASTPDGSRQQATASPDPLIEAIKQGSLDEVTALVSKGADVNARTSSGSTPLMYAANRNRPDIVEFLLGRGAEVNAKNGTNDTALIHASAKGSMKVADMLLQGKADPNIKNISGGDALIYAVMNKHLEMVELLLACGAEIDERYDDEKTALIMAIEEGAFKIALTLLAKGADANARDNEQMTALIYACDKGDIATVKALVAQGARIDAKSKYNNTALDTAISNRHVAVARFLIENGADFKSTGALSSAVITGSVDMVKSLVEKGADVNEKGSDGRTPLIYAAAGEPGMVKYLIAQGADVNAKDNEGKTALMAAVESFEESKLQTVKLLLEHGADCNAVGDKGETALIMAAKWGDIETVQMLLEKGSNVAAQDEQSKTAWTYAFEGAHSAVTGLLEKKGSPKAYDGVTWEGNSSNQEEEFIKVVGTKQEWANLWTRAFDKPAPDMDFEHYAVACVFLGHSASWLYSIELGKPDVRDNRLVIPYVLIDVMLRLSGPFRAGGQYRMTVFEKRQGLDMILENTTDHFRMGT